MLTREAIAQVERIENGHHERIDETFTRRDRDQHGFDAWKAATSAWHAQKYPTDALWSEKFIADLRQSKREAIEDVILYLEVDPWYFRSGYLKERLIRGLKATALTETDKKRLRSVIWNVCKGKNRREFRDYCSLALSVTTAEFYQLISGATTEDDHAAKGKFGYLKNYLAIHHR